MASEKKPARHVPFPTKTDALDHLHSGRAILQCYVDTIPDERADDRYVLWAVLAQLDKLYTFLD